MKFSLTVTCYNEMKSLPQWHEDLQAQTRQPNEIVIVDSESTDGTTELLKEWTRFYPRVKLIVKKCSPAKGHNIAVEAAAYEHVVSTDMGIRIDPEWFAEIVRPFEEVESVESIVKRFVVAGMSCGALSAPAHEDIAEAMNKLQAKSCSGEGGEDPARYETIKNSKIKQDEIGNIALPKKVFEEIKTFVLKNKIEFLYPTYKKSLGEVPPWSKYIYPS